MKDFKDFKERLNENKLNLNEGMDQMEKDLAKFSEKYGFVIYTGKIDPIEKTEKVKYYIDLGQGKIVGSSN